MSILIKGMEMPKSCSVCRLFGEYGCPFIGAVGYALTRGERNEDCPLVEVPPHGRLIDADKIGLTNFEIILCHEFILFNAFAVKVCIPHIEAPRSVFQFAGFFKKGVSLDVILFYAFAVVI